MDNNELDRKCHEMMNRDAHDFQCGFINIEPGKYCCACGEPESSAREFCTAGEIPKYSTDIAAAFEVVEWMTGQGIVVEIVIGYLGGSVRIMLEPNEWTVEADRCDALSLAICQAALKVFETTEVKQ